LAKSGKSLTNVSLNGSLTVSGNNIVVRNVSVKGKIHVTGDHVTLDRVTTTGVVDSGGSNLTVRRSHVTGGGTAVRISSDRGPEHLVRAVNLVGNYIHAPASSERDSYSGTHLRGAVGVRIWCSNYALGDYGTAAIWLEDVNGGTSEVAISNNWLNGGGYTVLTDARQLSVKQNLFGTAARHGICKTSGQTINQSWNRMSNGSRVQPCPTGTKPSPEPPVAPTPTPSPPKAGACVKPTATSTGATGTRQASSVTVLNTNGQVLQNVNVSQLTINADNVTVRNVNVNGRILVNDSAYNSLIDRVTAKHIGLSSPVGTRVLNSRVTRSTEDGFHITGDAGRPVENTTLRGNLVDSPVAVDPAHYDGLQVRGVKGLLVECNTINLGPWQSTFTAALFLENANGGNTGVRVLNNWLDGGGFIIYADGGGADFSRNVFGAQGRWGICYGDKASRVTGSGNTNGTGAAVNLTTECAE
jgi:hypothetical protein